MKRTWFIRAYEEGAENEMLELDKVVWGESGAEQGAMDGGMEVDVC